MNLFIINKNIIIEFFYLYKLITFNIYNKYINDITFNIIINIIAYLYKK